MDVLPSSLLGTPWLGREEMVTVKTFSGEGQV